MLRAFPFKLVTHNVGNMDSIGNAVFLAGEQRLACPHSTFMFRLTGYRLAVIRGGDGVGDLLVSVLYAGAGLSPCRRSQRSAWIPR